MSDLKSKSDHMARTVAAGGTVGDLAQIGNPLTAGYAHHMLSLLSTRELLGFEDEDEEVETKEASDA